MTDLHLPEELLHIILWHLKLPLVSSVAQQSEHKIRRKTLISCMLASRTLYRIAEPVLYHTIISDRAVPILACSSRHSRSPGQVRRLYATGDKCFIRVNSGLLDNIRSHDIHTKDMKLHNYLQFWMSEYQRTFLHDHVGYNIHTASIDIIWCAKLHDLVLPSAFLARWILPTPFLRTCVTQARNSPQADHIPLAQLRRFKVELQPEKCEPGLALYLQNDWLSCLASLPRIESICIPMITYPEDFQTSSQMRRSSLKVLTLTCMDLRPSHLRALLTAFPVLQVLDMTWPAKQRYSTSRRNMWAKLGNVLCNFGTSLRKIRFDTSLFNAKVTPRGALIDLISLPRLQYLALPIEAVLSEPAGEYPVPYLNSRGVGDDVSALHEAGKGVQTPTTPLDRILPPKLRRLVVMDDWNLWADALRLDMQLRDVILGPDCPELRSIRVKRKRPFSKHVQIIGWHEEKSQKFWKVMKRA